VPGLRTAIPLHTSDGARVHADDVIAVAAQALREGFTVAVKDIGGVHLVCDATSQAVTPLQRKHRDQKPLDVMVRDLAAVPPTGANHPRNRSRTPPLVFSESVDQAAPRRRLRKSSKTLSQTAQNQSLPQTRFGSNHPGSILFHSLNSP